MGGGREEGEGWMNGSGEKGSGERGVLTSMGDPQDSASPVSPSLIVGCVHTNITNHYRGGIRFG